MQDTKQWSTRLQKYEFYMTWWELLPDCCLRSKVANQPPVPSPSFYSWFITISLEYVIFTDPIFSDPAWDCPAVAPHSVSRCSGSLDRIGWGFIHRRQQNSGTIS